MHDRVEPLFRESLALLLGLPDVEVTKSAFDALECEMNDQPFGWFGTELFDNPSVESGVNRNILRERVGHASPSGRRQASLPEAKPRALIRPCQIGCGFSWSLQRFTTPPNPTRSKVLMR
jgi:hypothetical protein